MWTGDALAGLGSSWSPYGTETTIRIHPLNRDTIVGGYSGCKRNQAWLVMNRFCTSFLPFLAKAHSWNIQTISDASQNWPPVCRRTCFTMHPSMTCLPVFLSQGIPRLLQNRQDFSRRCAHAGVLPLVDHLSQTTQVASFWNKFGLLSAFALVGRGASKRAPFCSNAFTAAVRLLRTAKNSLRRALSRVMAFILGLDLFPGTNW